MVMKVIVVRDTRDLKSLGLQGLAGSTPARGTMTIWKDRLVGPLAQLVRATDSDGLVHRNGLSCVV